MVSTSPCVSAIPCTFGSSVARVAIATQSHRQFTNAHGLVSSRFLLRYVSRDEVALLDRGTGGVPDVRNAIDGYEEKSPLYGFLQYRRRKVVLSYLPEGMSRLVQGWWSPPLSPSWLRQARDPTDLVILLQPEQPYNSNRS